MSLRLAWANSEFQASLDCKKTTLNKQTNTQNSTKYSFIDGQLNLDARALEKIPGQWVGTFVTPKHLVFFSPSNNVSVLTGIS